VDELVSSDYRYPHSDWSDFETEYLNKLGFGNTLRHLTIPVHPVISGSLPNRNLLRFLPNNTVDTLLSADSLSTELPDIIDKTHACITSELDLDLESLEKGMSEASWIDAPSDTTAQLKGLLCTRIIQQLGGSIDFTALQSSVEFPGEASMEPNEYGIDVLVTCVSADQYHTVEVYSIENRAAFFDTAFGDDTYMFEKLRQSSTQPEFKIENIAFEIEGPSWYGSNPPEESIVYSFTDQKGRVDFYEIEDPAMVFGDSWGDIESMRSILAEDEGSHVGYSSGDWLMAAGMRV